MSKESFVSMFRSTADAIEFENQALSIGTEFLPEFALTVRDGGKPTEEYWTWLTEQFLSPGGHDFVDVKETGALTES